MKEHKPGVNPLSWKWSGKPVNLLGPVLLFGLLVRIGYMIWASRYSPFFNGPIVDAALYHKWALEIYQGNWMGREAFYQAPLFPYLLGLIYSVFNPGPWAIRIIHGMMGLGNIFLVFVLSRTLLPPLWSAAAAWLCTFYPGFVFFENHLLSETLSVHLFLWALFFSVRAVQKETLLSWTVPGLFIGLSALTKPNTLLLLVFLTIWLIATGRKHFLNTLGKASVLMLMAALVILPVTLRNWLVGGDAALISTNGAMTFVHGNNPSAVGTLALPQGFSGNIETQKKEEIEVASSLSGRPMTHREARHYWFTSSLKFLLNHPRFTSRLELLKLWRMIGNYEYADNYNMHYDENPVRYFMPLPFALLFSLATWGMLKSGWGSAEEQVYGIFLLVPFMTMMIFYMTSRYRFPAVPILTIFAARGLQSVMMILKQRRWKDLLTAGMAVVPVMVISFWPIEKRDFEARQWISEGVALMQQGNFEKAVERFGHAAEKNPSEEGLWINMGNALHSMGKPEDAIQAYEKALKVKSDGPTALMLMGVAYGEMGRFAESEAYLMRALKEMPNSGEVHLYLSFLYNKTGRKDEAKFHLKTAEEQGIQAPASLRMSLSSD